MLKKSRSGRPKGAWMSGSVSSIYSANFKFDSLPDGRFPRISPAHFPKEHVMKSFLAMYIGTAAATEKSKWNSLPEAERKLREQRGMQAWGDWMAKHQTAVVVQGAPLGKTKRIDPSGISDIKNNLVGYVLVQAESHEAAASMFENHPHFTLFPGDSVEIMECLPIPTR